MRTQIKINKNNPGSKGLYVANKANKESPKKPKPKAKK